jgi:hypothetical protein
MRPCIEAEATKVIHRLQPERGKKQAVRHMKRRSEEFDVIGRTRADAARISEARLGEKRVVRVPLGAHDAGTCRDCNDRSLAVKLVKALRSDGRLSRDVEIEVAR